MKSAARWTTPCSCTLVACWAGSASRPSDQGLELIMGKFAEPIAQLIKELRKLPGIGNKTAQRLAFHILRSSDDDATLLAAAIERIKRELHLCSVCNNITDVDPCVYCSSATRNMKQICVVEEPTNIAAVEKT